MKGSRKPWVMHLPAGLRDQQGWVFIGFMCALSGLAYLFGVAESTSITAVLHPVGLHVWGGVLTVAGFLIMGSVLTSNKPWEAFALRLLSVACLVYMGWVLVAVPFERAVFMVFLCTVLIVLAEVRVAIIKILLRPLPDSARRLMP